MTVATSLVLIAVGAILAFAVSTQVAGINIQTIGVILVIVGGIGLAIAMATLAGYSPWATRGNTPAVATTGAPVATSAAQVPPVAPVATPAAQVPPTAPPHNL